MSTVTTAHSADCCSTCMGEHMSSWYVQSHVRGRSRLGGVAGSAMRRHTGSRCGGHPTPTSTVVSAHSAEYCSPYVCQHMSSWYVQSDMRGRARLGGVAGHLTRRRGVLQSPTNHHHPPPPHAPAVRNVMWRVCGSLPTKVGGGGGGGRVKVTPQVPTCGARRVRAVRGPPSSRPPWWRVTAPRNTVFRPPTTLIPRGGAAGAPRSGGMGPRTGTPRQRPRWCCAGHGHPQSRPRARSLH